MEAKSEVHEAKGRADLILETDNRRIVFELKLAQNDEEAKIKLKEAVEQIKSRDYGNILPVKKELIRIAAVFNADTKVRAFKEVENVKQIFHTKYCKKNHHDRVTNHGDLLF